jgi:UPF0755 protein
MVYWFPGGTERRILPKWEDTFLKKIGSIFVTLVFLLFCVGSSLYLDLIRWSDHPMGEDPSIITIAVPPGQRFTTTIDKLHRAGLTNHPLKFRVLARIRGDDKRIKAGEYPLNATMTPNRILKALKKGHEALYRLTVPEGFSMRQIAQLAAQKGYGNAERFYGLATDPGFLQRTGLPGTSFEGYLYPDTYYLPREISPEKIIMTMVRRFREVFSPEWQDRARAMGFTVHQIVTLASIVEKEAGTGTERPVISSVFHNRLKRRMRLEADPTVIYGIPGFNGNLTRKDLKNPTPYNTYTIKGLPPGPIASPGYDALKAALYPAKTKYLYFVSRRDRTHQFSTNFSDHKRAVRKYQLRKKIKTRK